MDLTPIPTTSGSNVFANNAAQSVPLDIVRMAQEKRREASG